MTGFRTGQSDWVYIIFHMHLLGGQVCNNKKKKKNQNISINIIRHTYHVKITLRALKNYFFTDLNTACHILMQYFLSKTRAKESDLIRDHMILCVQDNHD